MRKLESAITFAVLVAAGTGVALAQNVPGKAPSPALKMTTAECQAIWSKADSGGAGSLSSSQAQPYVTDFKAVDSNGDGKLSASEFTAGCQNGLAHDSASSGGSSGTSGEGAPDQPKY